MDCATVDDLVSVCRVVDTVWVELAVLLCSPGDVDADPDRARVPTLRVFDAVFVELTPPPVADCVIDVE